MGFCFSLSIHFQPTLACYSSYTVSSAARCGTVPTISKKTRCPLTMSYHLRQYTSMPFHDDAALSAKCRTQFLQRNYGTDPSPVSLFVRCQALPNTDAPSPQHHKNLQLNWWIILNKLLFVFFKEYPVLHLSIKQFQPILNGNPEKYCNDPLVLNKWHYIKRTPIPINLVFHSQKYQTFENYAFIMEHCKDLHPSLLKLPIGLFHHLHHLQER